MPWPSSEQVLSELGLLSLIRSPRDVKFICAQRFVRMFAFGAAALILAFYLEELGYNDEVIGLFMTLTLLGDVVISLLLTLFADGIGRKNVLVAGSALVIVSGVVFATSSAYWALLIAAILGVISPSGMEIGPFRAIEESAMSAMAPKDIPNSRSDIYAWYQVCGTMGSALGAAVSGQIIYVLMHKYGFNKLESHRAIFWLYGGLGFMKLIFAACLSRRIELDEGSEHGQKSQSLPVEDEALREDEARPLLSSSKANATENRSGELTTNGSPSSTSAESQRTYIPQVSAQSWHHLAKMLPLLAIDNFASGLVPLSWLSPFFEGKFHLSYSALGILFFFGYILSASSNVVAASIVRRIGLLYTMVLTHLQSDIFLALIPVPNQVWLAITFLMLRNATCTMDTAPRQAFITTLLDPAERTAVMGFIMVVKTVAQAGGPYTSGLLKDRGMLWLSFLLAGGLKMIYDLGMLVGFWKYRHQNEDEKRAFQRKSPGSDEEVVGRVEE